jgi:hypothetical protein
LLQAAHSDYQTGAFKNLHQLVEDTLIVLRPGPKVFFQYELRVVNCLKSQLLIGHLCYPSKLLISHLFLPIKTRLPVQKREWEFKPILGNISAFSSDSINFCFNVEALSARSRRLPGSTPLQCDECRHAQAKIQHLCQQADITEIASRIDEAALSFERLLRHRRAAEHRQRKGSSRHQSTHMIPS